jgi:hypothetical protein
VSRQVDQVRSVGEPTRTELIWLAGDMAYSFEMSNLNMINLVGYLAASLVLATFCMGSMSRLRLMALASNLAFIAYSYLANLMPVLILHAVLLPVNAYRLAQWCWVELRPKHPIT